MTLVKMIGGQNGLNVDLVQSSAFDLKNEKRAPLASSLHAVSLIMR